MYTVYKTHSLGIRGFWLCVAQLSCPKRPSRRAALREKTQISQTDLLDDPYLSPLERCFFHAVLWEPDPTSARHWFDLGVCPEPSASQPPIPKPLALDTQRGCGWLGVGGETPADWLFPGGQDQEDISELFSVLIKHPGVFSGKLLSAISHPALHNWAAQMGQERNRDQMRHPASPQKNLQILQLPKPTLRTGLQARPLHGTRCFQSYRKAPKKPKKKSHEPSVTT